MKFALIDGLKIEAYKGAEGVCQSCGAELISKCGEFKINHWAHKKKHQCDTWWENETEWHRKWKGKFPVEWQEITHYDKTTNEKHIADVRTENGLIIEFQHSNINPDERRIRENFYKNMIWVVDGTRLKRDYPRFLKGKLNEFENTIFYKTDNPKIFQIDLVDWCFPVNWIQSSVPVIFDYLGDGTLEDTYNLRNNLYCLFPQIGRLRFVAEFSRETFIKAIKKGDWAFRVKQFLNHLVEQNTIIAQREKLELEKRKAINRAEFNKKLMTKRFRRSRRF
ncbi:competence protein CoiA family protein [Wenyingzhuangia sp. chi5]|uniref:Competence protein CoiA family protein n=1 Tax=Wenyingzhuangia gilva TaxID=3057677 RepID=A0ABT8VVP6_9FLAO|nr:competence protein CoiA family protein [Wenyingzhuangia sp. chi5]MDO3696002.1 competence protein CoiA family protein [Wenyingzhuangia sp. chi5]